MVVVAWPSAACAWSSAASACASAAVAAASAASADSCACFAACSACAASVCDWAWATGAAKAAVITAASRILDCFMGVLPKELVVFPAIAPHSESRKLACRPPLATEQRAFNLRASLSYELDPDHQPNTNECTLRRSRPRRPVGAGPGQAPPGPVYRPHPPQTTALGPARPPRRSGPVRTRAGERR